MDDGFKSAETSDIRVSDKRTNERLTSSRRSIIIISSRIDSAVRCTAKMEFLGDVVMLLLIGMKRDQGGDGELGT